MLLAFNIADIVMVPFGQLLYFLYNTIGNYGLAIILFAVIVQLVLLPMTAKSKKSTMKMSRLQPKVQAIKKKYPDDQQKATELFNKSMADILNQEVDIDLRVLTDDAFGRLCLSNDWTFAQMDELEAELVRRDSNLPA